MRFSRGLYELESKYFQPHLAELEHLADGLSQLPSTIEVRFASRSHRRDVNERGDPGTLALIGFADLYNYLKFFLFSNLCKSRQLLAGLVDAYNTRNYLVWTLLARSSVEYAAVFFYFKRQLDPLDLHGPNFKASQLRQLDDIMVKYAHGTRFNWDAMMDGDADGLRASSGKNPKRPMAVNVLTAIDHLSRQDNRFGDLRVTYDMLSDFTHPNMGSHTVVVDHLPAEGITHRWNVTPFPGPERGEFVVFLTLPAVALCLSTIVHLSAEVGRVVDRWAEMIERSEVGTVDMTQ